jgi:hypothetical protein
MIPTFHPKVKTAIPTGVSRCFFFSFAPAKESAREVEESLFDLTSDGSGIVALAKKQTEITDVFTNAPSPQTFSLALQDNSQYISLARPPQDSPHRPQLGRANSYAHT